MLKHEPKARTLCYNCFNNNHADHNKDFKFGFIKVSSDKFGKCECPICNYCLCDWCKEQCKIYGIKELS